MALPRILFTAAEAAPLLGLRDQRVIQAWVRRGKLSSIGYTADGAQLFLWADLIAARTTRRPDGSAARPIDPIRPVMHAAS